MDQLHFGGRRPWFCLACPCQGPILRGSQCCTLLASFSDAEAVTSWLTRASNKARCFVASASHRKRPRLGGSSDPFESFPEKPRGIHQRTYSRPRARAEAAEAIAFGRRWGFSVGNCALDTPVQNFRLTSHLTLRTFSCSPISFTIEGIIVRSQAGPDTTPTIVNSPVARG
jgi:hypothetical protein